MKDETYDKYAKELEKKADWKGVPPQKNPYDEYQEDYEKMAPIEPRIQKQWTEIESAQKAYDVTLHRILKVKKAIDTLQNEEDSLYSALGHCKQVVDKLLFPPEPQRSYGGQD